MAKQAEQYDPLPDSLTELGDTPDSYAGQANRVLTVKVTEDGLEFGSYSRLGDRAAIGTVPVAGVGLGFPSGISTAENFAVIKASPLINLTANMRSIYAFQGQAVVKVSPGATALTVAGLYFTAIGNDAGTIGNLFAVWARAGLQMYTGPACSLWGLKVESPMLMFSTYPTTIYGIEIDDQGRYSAGTHDAIALKINNQTATAGDKRLIEAGPTVPFFRLEGGDVPIGENSMAIVNFGGTLYRLTRNAGTGAVETVAV